MTADAFASTSIVRPGSFRAMAAADTRDAQGGYSLLMVLLLMLAVASVLAPVTARIKAKALHETALLRIDELNALAQGLSVLLADQTGNGGDAGQAHLLANSTRYRCRVGSVHVTFAFQNQSGLIDLNRASEALLAKGFQSLGLAPAMAERLAQLVSAYRSYKPDDGAPAGLEIANGLKNAPFESVAELFDMQALRDLPLAQINRTFTIHSGSSRIAPAHAPNALAVRLSDKDTTGVAPQSPGPLDVLVTVMSGRMTGRFHGVYRYYNDGRLRLVETWRHDIGDEGSDPVDAGDCSARFGPEFVQLVAEAV
ncbi:hypothetical protein [Oricola sp.]|uniref:hypothetical protein n=1 Tax=Oricola sp. TaxID=1979950 RepID=UPI0025DBCB63|nr:hypothetical protein [Oricola sp.]MCI5075344.1 hypothetical protein [Oricola sp.]